MKTRKLSALLLALALLLPCLGALPAAAADGGTQLYYQLGPATEEETRKVWQTNTNLGWMRKCDFDGKTWDQYDFYNNNHNADGSGLPKGATMCITVPDVSISTRGSEEIVFSMQYVFDPMAGDSNIGLMDRFQLFASIDGGKTWSENCARLEAQTLLGSGHSTSNNRDVWVYLVTSTDLKPLVRDGATINALKLLPYGSTTYTATGATRIHYMEVTGYPARRPAAAASQVGTIDVPEETMRQTVVQRILSIIDVPWKTDREIVTYNNNNGYLDEAHTQYYKPGVTYTAPIYTRPVRGTREIFEASILPNGRYTGGVHDDKKDVIGLDCICIVSDALAAVSTAPHYSWANIMTNAHLPLLGGVKNDEWINDSELVQKANDEQAVYEGYAALKPGDYILQQYTPEGAAEQVLHIRLAVEPSEVVRTKRGAIDPTKSKVFMAETKGAIEYYWQTPEGKIVASTEKDVDSYQAAHPTFKLLYGSSCRKRTEYTFDTLYANHYLAYTLEEYAAGKVSDVQVKCMTDATAANVTGGFHPILTSNWWINSVRVRLTDMSTGVDLMDDVKNPPQGSVNYRYSDIDMDQTLRELTGGAYRLTVDVTSGPITRVGGSAPTANVFTLDFAVGGAAIPSSVPTLDTAGADGWAVNWLNEAFARGLLSEMNRSGFTRDVTRLQFADLAVRLAEVITFEEIEPAAADSFTDTAEPSILKAKAAGIAGGYEVNGQYEFRPDNPITRQEICVMLDHVAEYVAGEMIGKDLLFEETEIDAKFIDRAQVADWAKKQVARMTGNMVMGGKATDKGDAITPQANTTLQEAVTLAIKLDGILK